MNSITMFNVGEKLFILTLIVSFIMLIFYFLYNKFFIYKNRKEFGFLLYGNDGYIEHVSFEDIFIMTSNFSRVYISYVFEILIFKKNKTVFFKNGEDSNPYIYPNLSFKNMKLIFLKFKGWIIFNISFHLLCLLLFGFLIFLIENYIK
ncbi:hypothetical protein [Acinetobacter indicus]|uniref:hypothetical protein n=1 Tax=Acinetobacter indicus TaxID=756892 RepID=UPI00143FF6A6|nr:hypothetical protein [Acinetobacter indicus]MDM1292647.1 hypothetical protein [Acinetobacter indicus]MDM1322659.1 hypothetical protein [Acinetobacter indicus]MDM1334396.1 hypothetical protein [Acinetobacter indicus]QIZ58762.1 hypothetical protein FK537_06250 [Acinetobacter indicus]